MIKRYQPDSPLVRPIGIVAPSRGAEQNAIQQQRTASNLLNIAYQGAIQEQRTIGNEYAVKIAVRNTEGNIEYQEIPDAFSPIARRTAQSQIDQRYETALRADINEKAKAFRFKDDGSPASAQDYENKMTSYIAKTKELNGRYGNFVEEYSLPLIAQNLTDIKHKAYDASMKADFIAMQSQIEGHIADLAATSESMAGQQQIVVDESGQSVSMSEVLYRKTLENIDELALTHGSRIEGAMVKNMRNQAKLAYYNGQLKRIAGLVSTRIQQEGLSPFQAYDEEKAYLNDMISSLQSVASYDALPAPRKNVLAEFGFDREFVENSDMLFQRKQMASELATYQGTRAEQFSNDQKARANDLAAFIINSGNIASQQQVDSITSQLGIVDGYSTLANVNNILNDSRYDVVKRSLMGDSPLFKGMQEMFESPDILMMAASQGKLDDVLTLWNNVTTKFDSNGRSFTTSRGVSAKGVAMMETLAAYSSVMQTMDMNEFFAKQQEFTRFGVDEQNTRIKGMLESGYEGDIDKFVKRSTGIDTPQELIELRSIAPTLIYAHGVETANKILKETADKLYKKSDFLYGIEGKSMYSPEARYGREFPTFIESAELALAQAGPQYSFVNGNVKLIFDRRGGGGFPVYIAVNGDTGLPIRDASNQMIRVGGIGVIAQRQLSNAEAVAMYREFLQAEQQRINEQRVSVPSDEGAEALRFRK